MPRTLARAERTAPDARWGDAVRVTVALWAFTLLLYLPSIAARHAGEPFVSIVLDCSSVIPSILFGFGLFAAFRAGLALRAYVRFALMIVAIFTFAAAQTYFDHVYTAWIAATLQPSWASLAVNLRSAYSTTLLYAGVFAVNLALFQLAHSHRRTRRQDARLAELTATGQRSELDHLRLRLNPHFLFNTLNGVSSLVVTGRAAEAEELIARLSGFLRATIASDPGALVPLEEEFALAERYLAIEEARFAERLRIDVGDPTLGGDASLPALTVQPLVEAALRDGLASPTRWVRLRLAAAREDGRLRIDLACRFRRTDPLDRDARESIANLRRRLDALYGAAATLDIQTERGGFAATLRLPLMGEMRA